MQHYTKQVKSPLLQLLCVSLVVMWGQGTEATASPQPLKDATFKTLPVSDVMFTEDVLWEKPARSRMECSVMCRGDAQCLMFTFRPATDGPAGSCRSHRKQKTRKDEQVSTPRARSFNLVGVAEAEAEAEPLIDKACTTSVDCTEYMTACFSGKCLCAGGFFYDNTQNACVESCRGHLGNTYLVYIGWALRGHAQYYKRPYYDVSICYLICTADPKCVTFAYFRPKDECYFKYVTPRELSDQWVLVNDANFYQRTCN